MWSRLIGDQKSPSSDRSQVRDELAYAAEMAHGHPGFVVKRDAGVDPRSPEGLALFAVLLGGQPEVVETFDVDWDPGDGHARHRHNGGLAVAITGGSVTFGFNADRELVEARPGDYVLIGEGTLHDELTTEGVQMVGAHLGGLETYDE